MTAPNVSAVYDWLVDGARSVADPAHMVSELCDRLVGAGVPLWRVGVFVRTLHPQVMGRRFLWQAGAGVAITEAGFEAIDAPEFLASPVVHVYNTGAGLRRRLADAACPMDFSIFHDIRAEGGTDYLVSPLLFTNGEIHVATWSTRQPGGFSDEQIAVIEGVIAPLARVAEIYALRRTAANLLDAYVGHDAGERILAGQIRRGDTETIHAVIWLSDMRGFTALADSISPERLIEVLNRYFDCQVPAIIAHGGEVLKFMGDGLLAIFPTRGDVGSACGAALTAALDVEKRIAGSGRQGESDIGVVLRFGVALHLGEVLYGNVGGGNRLDFTCIGPGVNLAARIEALTSKTGHPILASSDFARHCEAQLVPVGEFLLRGFSAAETIFAVSEVTRSTDG